MSAPIIPWEPSNIPDQIQIELDRRRLNRGFSYLPAEKGGWANDTGDWTKYKGPTSPWVRVCSNGRGSIADGKEPKEGFVFYSGDEFYSGYGFQTNSSGTKESIIGHTPDGQAHVLEHNLRNAKSPIHTPPPEIEKISVVVQKELLRRCTIEWVCFSAEQLEYLTPYLLTANISVIVEWGWNHYDPSCLLDLTSGNKSQLKKWFMDPRPLYNERVLKSRGNYDILFGIISGFSWSMDGNKIKVKTEITSKGWLYGGITADSTPIVDSGDDQKAEPLGDLKSFLKTATTQFKSIREFKKHPTAPPKDPLDGIRKFIDYMKLKPNFEDTLYGVYYGRDVNDKKGEKEPRAEHDWDKNSSGDCLWLNLGLVMEIINFHTSQLPSPIGTPMFEFDINDVVISGHPNLISCNGDVLLIPNSSSPKYFYGNYGDRSDFSDPDKGDYPLEQSSERTGQLNSKDTAKKNKQLPSYRLRKICWQPENRAYRDNIDMVINDLRYSMVDKSKSFAFPFLNDYTSKDGNASKSYPKGYSGFLKNLYVNIKFLKEVADSEKTFRGMVEKMMRGISEAAGGFWDFRVVDETSKAGQTKQATLKVVDYNFVSTLNTGKVYVFNYMDPDSLFMGVNFNPTLSNAAAIRTMYNLPPGGDPKTSITLSSDTELLEGHFTDRLYEKEPNLSNIPKMKASTAWIETMKSLQSVNATKDAFQVTTKAEGIEIVKRLVLPNAEILKMLLDDGDVDYNPKYTGIMPGIQAQFTVQGIGGLRTFMMFLVKNLPRPYSAENVVFRIIDMQDNLDDKQWTTTITAGVIPLREHIKARLGLK
jgi:hypothetical protein